MALLWNEQKILHYIMRKNRQSETYPVPVFSSRGINNTMAEKFHFTRRQRKACHFSVRIDEAKCGYPVKVVTLSNRMNCLRAISLLLFPRNKVAKL